MATTSPFSFHCMICYEGFDTTNRYPVVLPCGHTYVCIECANRIDRCMECRTSVFEAQTVPPYSREITSDPSMGRANTRSAQPRLRNSRGILLPPSMSGDTPTEVKLEPRRLPMPKNVVLMSLMHATEHASKTAEDHHNLLKRTISLDEDEDEKIARITEIAAGACGTYAVASKKGLQIVPKIPKPFNKKKKKRRQGGDQSNYVDWEGHVNNIISKNSGMNIGRSPMPTEDEDDNHTYTDGIHLRFGDRVQVVTIVDGWAKLARGYGFVHTKSTSDLIKVGGALDKACNLEAMILSRSLRRNELRQEQARVERDALSIMNDMQQTLTKEDDLTVIAAEAFTLVPTPKQRECRDDQDHIQLLNSSSTKSEGSSTKSASYVVRDEFREEYVGGGLCFGKGLLSIFNCNSGESTRKVFPSNPKIGQDDMVAGAERWRLQNGKEAVTGTTVVDFRTGISGHHAMQSHEVHSHPHNFLDKEKASPSLGLPKMSQHSGLTVTRRFKSSLSFS